MMTPMESKHVKGKGLKFTLEQATKAQRESRRIGLLFLNFGASWGWVVNATPRPLYPWKDPVPIV
jgi:hypothetical protein